jgi:hypothetical protein
MEYLVDSTKVVCDPILFRSEKLYVAFFNSVQLNFVKPVTKSTHKLCRFELSKYESQKVYY